MLWYNIKLGKAEGKTVCELLFLEYDKYNWRLEMPCWQNSLVLI